MSREHHVSAILLVVMTMTLVQRSQGHGYMLEPPSRSSMWRVGFNTPTNYDDNAVRCAISEPNCGVCGNKDNQAGGKYATGTIGKTYTEGQRITVTIVITANHLGYFEFYLCDNDDITKTATEECMNRHLLQFESGGTKYYLKDQVMGGITMHLLLPEGVTCSQCVLRWFYKTGNSWGVDSRTRVGCLGCGNQERFFSCADVSIVSRQQQNGNKPSFKPGKDNVEDDTMFDSNRPVLSNTPVPSNRPRPRPRPTASPIRPLRPTIPPMPAHVTCVAINNWAGDAVLDAWCNTSCRAGICPSILCRCR